jgi:hypothetical protein
MEEFGKGWRSCKWGKDLDHKFHKSLVIVAGDWRVWAHDHFAINLKEKSKSHDGIQDHIVQGSQTTALT